MGQHKILKLLLLIVVIFFLASFIFDRPAKNITYGVSFSKFHADELNLDWKKVYLALLDDLKVRNFRFSAHWPNTEPQEGKFNFSELDFQMKEAQRRGASVILAVGRRLPGWPECHNPGWLAGKDVKYQNEKLLDYTSTTVNHFKSYNNIRYWQVENEPFLGFFGRSHCDPLDESFLKQEVALVKKLDPNRQVLVTDSGEFGTWYHAYQNGDIFGTSMYLYVWNRVIGPMRYPITPLFFRVKKTIVELFYGSKPSILIELSSEPWLLHPIVDTEMTILLDRMGIDKFNNMIDFATKTGFQNQYLWGAEWWYWMKAQGHPEYWSRAKQLFQTQN